METASIIFLLVSASISFAVGRTIMHFRKKKQAHARFKAQESAAQLLRDAPPGPEPKNKGKRKRLARQSR